MTCETGSGHPRLLAGGRGHASPASDRPDTGEPRRVSHVSEPGQGVDGCGFSTYSDRVLSKRTSGLMVHCPA